MQSQCWGQRTWLLRGLAGKETPSEKQKAVEKEQADEERTDPAPDRQTVQMANPHMYS